LLRNRFNLSVENTWKYPLLLNKIKKNRITNGLQV
jgi:hypothetical protein